jgi:RsiG-like
VEPLPDLTTLTSDELSAMIRELEREEDQISRRRRLLHERIDLLRAEHVQRLREHVTDGDALPEPRSLTRPLFEGSGDVPEEHELEPLPDPESLDDDDLRRLIRDLEREEDDISLRRRFLHGQIDILRAARYDRIRGGTLDVDDLARVLTHRQPTEPDEQA